MDRNHRWDRPLGSLGIKPHSPFLSGTLHSDPFQTNRHWTICLDIMVLAYLLLHPRAPNRINLIHIHGTNLKVESRESWGRWKRGKSAEGYGRDGWIGGAVERVKDGGGRANVCPSELDFSPASVSLLATLWLNYLQSTSNIFKLNFMYAQSCIFPLFLRYETALRSTEGSIPRRVRETGSVPYSYYVQTYTTEHAGAIVTS